MADLKQKALTILASTVAGMQTGDGKAVLYTVPPGKKTIIVADVVRDPTASLAGGTDFDFGDGANADTWKQSVDLSGMTASTDYMVITSDNTKYTIFAAGAEFGVKPITGATADANATHDLIGYEVDA